MSHGIVCDELRANRYRLLKIDTKLFETTDAALVKWKQSLYNAETEMLYNGVLNNLLRSKWNALKRLNRTRRTLGLEPVLWGDSELLITQEV